METKLKMEVIKLNTNKNAKKYFENRNYGTYGTKTKNKADKFEADGKTNKI